MPLNASVFPQHGHGHSVCKVSVPVVQEVEQIVDVPTVKHRQRWVERFVGSGFGTRGLSKETLMGTSNRQPQEYSRNIIGIYLPGSLYTIIFLLYSWGSLFGVPIKVPLVFKYLPKASNQNTVAREGSFFFFVTVWTSPESRGSNPCVVETTST